MPVVQRHHASLGPQVKEFDLVVVGSRQPDVLAGHADHPASDVICVLAVLPGLRLAGNVPAAD